MKLSKTILLTLSLIASLFGFGITSSLPVFADDSSTTNICNSDASDEAKKASGCPGFSSSSNFQTLLITILNSIIGIVGLIAVVFIIIGGINYITSAGDAGKVKKAKDTILYASIGIAICALAFAIVNWVISIIPA